MKKRYKFVMLYLNLSGILNLTITEDKPKVSKLAVAFNLLVFPLLFCLNLTTRLTVFNENVRESANFIAAVSVFMLTTMITVSFQNMTITFFCVYISLWNRQKTIFLIESCVKTFQIFQLSKSSKKFIQLEQKCCKNVCLSFTASALIKIVYFFVTFEIRWKSLYMAFIFEWFEGIVMAFFALMSIFLLYFSYLLQELKLEMKSSSYEPDCDQQAAKFFIIYDLVTEFNELFGHLLSLTVAFAISVSTIRVGIKLQFRNLLRTYISILQFYFVGVVTFGAFNLNMEFKFYNILSAIPLLIVFVSFVVMPSHQLMIEVN